MFCKATLFTITLALIASASPTIHKQGIRIDLPKRSSLTRADGVFDHQKATIQTVKTMNKHRQNLINLEANRGRKAFNEGAEIKALAVLPTHLTKRQSEALTDQEDDVEWTGSISIGSSNQTFVIDFDTGSSDLWVPNASRCSGCSGKHTYSSSSSSTSKSKAGTFNIQYGDGSTVSGPIFTDSVTVGGVMAKSQAFSAVTELSDFFSTDPTDGILGLASKDISNLNISPFFQTAFAQGAVPANSFSFKLAPTGSSLFLGGSDASLFKGSVEFHPISDSGFWQVPGAKVLVNGKAVISDFETIIDSGTSIMYGPPAAVESLYTAVPGAELFDEQGGLYSFPCDSVPDVAFNWGGKAFSISAENFNLGQTEDGSSDCVGALSGQDTGLGNNVWLLGDSFMKNVYTVFDFDQNAVGFADLA